MIPFISIASEKGKRLVKLTPEARNLLVNSLQHETSVGFLVMMHPRRTGMSTLVNRAIGYKYEPSSKTGLWIHTVPVGGTNPATGQPMATLLLEVCLDDLDTEAIEMLIMGALVRMLASSVWFNTRAAWLEINLRNFIFGFEPWSKLFCAPAGQQLHLILRDMADRNESYVQACLANNSKGNRLNEIFPLSSVVAVPRPFAIMAEQAFYTHSVPAEQLDVAFVKATDSLGIIARHKTPALADLRGEPCTGKGLLVLVESAINSLNDAIRGYTELERAHIRSELSVYLIDDIVNTLVMPYIIVMT